MLNSKAKNLTSIANILLGKKQNFKFYNDFIYEIKSLRKAIRKFERMKGFISICYFIFVFLGSLTAQERQEDFYEDGALKASGTLKNQKKEGPWQYYYPDGKLNAEENYQNGELHGIVKYYVFL